MHRLLTRQLRRLGLKPEAPPSEEQWRELLRRVSHSYTDADQDRYLIERSLTISSREMQELNEALRHSSESRIAAERDRAEAANRAKSVFLANMSHELRTPLNAILGRTEALMTGVYGPSPEAHRSHLWAIDSSAEHLLALINDVLDLSKIEAGKLAPKLERLNAGQICRASLALVEQAAAAKHLRLELEVDPSAPTLTADGRQLKQILVNLLSNAVKFTPEKGRVQLRVTTHPESATISFAVRDTGIGIAAADQQDLCEPFVQLDSGLARKYDGTGLGLALVKRLTELHGGTLTLDSAPGQGSTFTVALPWAADTDQSPREAPLRAAPPRAVEATSEIPRMGASREATSSTAASPALPAQAPREDDIPNGSQPHILLAEDNDLNRGILVDLLEFHGFRTSTAQNGEEAIERAHTDCPDLILMDVQMPILDGLTAIRRLREGGHDGPIVALTGLAMKGDEERCRAAGADGYLSKPLRFEELEELIHAQLSG